MTKIRYSKSMSKFKIERGSGGSFLLYKRMSNENDYACIGLFHRLSEAEKFILDSTETTRILIQRPPEF